LVEDISGITSGPTHRLDAGGEHERKNAKKTIASPTTASKAQNVRVDASNSVAAPRIA
jgi:hypothetical protein